LTAPEPSLDALVDATQGPQPARRLFHAACGLGYAWLIARSGLGRHAILSIMVAAATLALVGDVLRLRVPALNRFFFRLFQPLASPRERRSIASSTWYAIGVAATFALFRPAQAVAAVLVLALADPAASYLGRRWGRRTVGTGTVLGSGIFMVGTYLIVLGSIGPVRALPVAVFVTLVELLPWPLDDNLTIPLATGLALWALGGLG
jgi:dolichol kinase